MQTGSRPGRRLRVLNSQKKRLPEDHPGYYQQNSGKMSSSKAKLAHAGSHVSSARELRQLVAASQKKKKKTVSQSVTYKHLDYKM